MCEKSVHSRAWTVHMQHTQCHTVHMRLYKVGSLPVAQPCRRLTGAPIELGRRQVADRQVEPAVGQPDVLVEALEEDVERADAVARGRRGPVLDLLLEVVGEPLDVEPGHGGAEPQRPAWRRQGRSASVRGQWLVGGQWSGPTSCDSTHHSVKSSRITESPRNTSTLSRRHCSVRRWPGARASPGAGWKRNPA